MPRLTGIAAKHFWIAYTSDQLDDASPPAPINYKVQVSLRHIHWLKTLGFTNADLELDPTIDYKIGSGTVDLKPRKMALTNGTKRRTVVFPIPQRAIWQKAFNDTAVASVAVTLEGESGTFRICGRAGEKESNPVPNYAGE